MRVVKVPTQIETLEHAQVAVLVVVAELREEALGARLAEAHVGNILHLVDAVGAELCDQSAVLDEDHIVTFCETRKANDTAGAAGAQQRAVAVRGRVGRRLKALHAVYIGHRLLAAVHRRIKDVRETCVGFGEL